MKEEEKEEEKQKENKTLSSGNGKKLTHLHKIYFEYRCTCAIHYSSPSFCFDLRSIHTHSN